MILQNGILGRRTRRINLADLWLHKANQPGLGLNINPAENPRVCGGRIQLTV